MLRNAAILIAGLLAILAVGHFTTRSESGPLVLAAASLQESLEAAADAWADKGHPRPVLSFAATSALARQIEAGAPADLFVAADEAWMDEVERKGHIRPLTRSAFLGNQLVLIAPSSSTIQLAIEPGFPLTDALDSGRLAMADPDTVPAGRYARQALTSMGIWTEVSGHIARAENVRAALALVSRGEAPLGIVYETDALAEPGVRIVGRFPAGSHVPVIYPLASLNTSRHKDAEAFRQYLLSAEGKAIFHRFGFTALEAP